MAKKFLSAIQLLTVNADPASASAGDLYFNTNENAIKYNDGTNWNSIPKFISGSSLPQSSTNGSFFYNTTEEKLYFYFNQWILFDTEFIDLNGEDSSTTEFALTVDGGDSAASEFSPIYNGGTSFS